MGAKSVTKKLIEKAKTCDMMGRVGTKIAFKNWLFHVTCFCVGAFVELANVVIFVGVLSSGTRS